MRAALLLVLLAAAPARAWGPFGKRSADKIRPVQALADADKPREVIAALTPEFIQSLRGNDVRQAYVLMGDNLDKLGRVDDALGVYQLGVKLFPKNVDLLTRQGGLLHRSGLDEQARPLFHKALEFEPRHYGAHLGLAEIYRKLGFLDRSASHYEGALETLDGRAQVWRDYAETLLAQRDWTTAELAIQKALQLEPENPDGRVIAGFARRAQGDLAAAVAFLDAAIERGAGIGPKRAKALWLVEAEKWAEASAAADVVLKEDPADGAALWAKARARMARGGGKSSPELEALAAGKRSDLAARAARSLKGGPR